MQSFDALPVERRSAHPAAPGPENSRRHGHHPRTRRGADADGDRQPPVDHRERRHFIENGRGHPRTSGTYARELGSYVCDQGAVPLMDALRRMTLDPARRLERRVPAIPLKGRVRAGADADLTVFNAATVIDRSTDEDATIPSAGIPYVLVGGQVVVDRGELRAARPGRPIRPEVSVGGP